MRSSSLPDRVYTPFETTKSVGSARVRLESLTSYPDMRRWRPLFAPAHLQALLASPAHLVLVAQIAPATAVVGALIANVAGTAIDIEDLLVEPDVRQRGAGRALVAALGRIASANGQGLVLEVAADNHAAQRLYARLGFKRSHTRPAYYRRLHGYVDADVLFLPATCRGHAE